MLLNETKKICSFFVNLLSETSSGHLGSKYFI